MEKKKAISLVLALAISTGLLAGCEASTKTEVSDNTQSIIEPTIVDSNRVDNYEEIPETKVFAAGEHVFMIRYNYFDELGYKDAESVNSVSITVPEGYEVLDVENFTALGNKIGTNQTYGVDVWFINNETVEVAPVFNKAFNSYDYSQPGKVVEPTVTEKNELGK